MTDTIEAPCNCGTAETATESAARGAALLEAHKPGSVARLDPATLDIRSNTTCPLSQVFAAEALTTCCGYCAGIDALYLPTSEAVTMSARDWGCHNGFDAGGTGLARNEAFDALQAAWLALIAGAQS